MTSFASGDATLSGRARIALRALWCCLLVGLAVHVSHAILGYGGKTADDLIGNWVYDAILVGSAAACAARAALVPVRRFPWALMAVGLFLWAGGDIFWTVAIEGTKAEDGVTLADAGWLSFYPCAYVALGLLVRSRMPRLPQSVWLDGLIAAAGIGSLGAALVLPTLEHSAAGAPPLTLAVNLGYPVFDLILVCLAVGVFALTGWRPDRMWLLLGAGMAISGVADSWYELSLAKGTYVSGGLTDSLWPASTMLIARAAWQHAATPRRIRLDGLRTILVPTALGLLALGIEIFDHFSRVDNVALALASGALGAVLVRLFLAFRENQAMLARSEREALTDALTGLGNRRRLMLELDDALIHVHDSPRLLVTFDLDGFKAYNDTFGHPAGDALLARLGRKLAKAVEGYGTTYRMGGDEFCALIDATNGTADEAYARAARALSEQGSAFTVGSSHGAVRLPDEAQAAPEALQIADQRLYAQKSGRKGSPRTQARDVLMRVLREREPDLHEHLRNVSRLAVAVARSIDLSSEEIDEIARGAELHDVGKMAIPDAILNKEGPLDEREWHFIRRHTLIGESILAAAPALVPVARLVRSSHERYDGRGYPDALAGNDIPLGSRIIFACDAFDAMTSSRPYATAMSVDQALSQIEHGAGTQFDPDVAASLIETVRSGVLDEDLPERGGLDMALWVEQLGDASDVLAP
jgi:two-component system, cell cycle response regulator